MLLMATFWQQAEDFEEQMEAEANEQQHGRAARELRVFSFGADDVVGRRIEEAAARELLSLAAFCRRSAAREAVKSLEATQ